MATLGGHYAQGKGVPADPVKAHAWSLEAAEAGQVGAMFDGGFDFERGHGTEQDDQLAVIWYGRAAAKNHPEATKNLASLRAAGRDQPITRALIGTIDTYLIHRLTGGSEFATDSTNASRTLLFDIVDRRWSAALCALWQVPPHALATVRDNSADFGATDLGGRWAKPLPIRGVMGDSQAALLAQRCFAPGTAKVTFGTGSSVLLNIGPTPRFSAQGTLTTLAWTLGDEIAYAFEGVIISSASTLTWLRDQLGLAARIEELDQWASALPDNGGVYLVPAFTGLGLPHWAPEARAAIVGLSNHSDKRHVARAAYESIAYQVRDALDAMRAEAGVTLSELAADGGPTVSAFLMQFTADITGVDLRVSQVAECSALGAVTAGRIQTAGLAPFLRDTTAGAGVLTYRPQRSAPDVAQQLSGWRKAVRQVLAAPPQLDGQ